MATKERMNRNASQFGTLDAIHKTATYTVKVHEQNIGVAGGSGAFTLTLPDAFDADGLDYYVFRDDASGTVTVVPPTGNQAFETSQAITGIATGFGHYRAVGGKWSVVDNQLS